MNVHLSFSGGVGGRRAVQFVAVSHEVNGANLLGITKWDMDRQQIIAVIFTVLMVGSMVAWGATLI